MRIDTHYIYTYIYTYIHKPRKIQSWKLSRRIINGGIALFCPLQFLIAKVFFFWQTSYVCINDTRVKFIKGKFLGTICVDLRRFYE